MTTTKDAKLLARAKAGWYRAGGASKAITGGEVARREGLVYVVLSGLQGAAPVYRVRHNGPLRRLRRSSADLSLPRTAIYLSTSLVRAAIGIANRVIAKTGAGNDKADQVKLRWLIARVGLYFDAAGARSDRAALSAGLGLTA